MRPDRPRLRRPAPDVASVDRSRRLGRRSPARRLGVVLAAVCVVLTLVAVVEASPAYRPLSANGAISPIADAPEAMVQPGAAAVPTASAPTASAPTSTAPAATVQPSPSVTPVPAAALRAALEAVRTEYGVPGVSATIIWPDGRSWTGASGLANVRTGIAVDRQTAFAIGSVTKTFVAALILELSEEGRLGLDDPVRRWLPTAAVASSVTIRQLLDHTSGLYDYFSNPLIDPALFDAPRRVWTAARSLSYVKRPYFEPGTNWAYSNTNYVLLGMIAERVTGTRIATELRRRFFDPLKLRTVFVQAAETPRAPVAHSYRFLAAGVSARPIDLSDGTAVAPFTSLTTAAGSAGAMASSSWDLARWARALYGGRVLKPETLLAMYADADLTDTLPWGPRYGLGVTLRQIDGRDTVGHGGRLLGARSEMRYLPTEGVAIAVVTNQSRTDTEIVVKALLNIAVPISTPSPSPSPTAPAPTPSPGP